MTTKTYNKLFLADDLLSPGTLQGLVLVAELKNCSKRI